ncbi:MAG TPA: hypothetical protein VL522_01065 [Bordetella sp.]|jgi:hypothetical protein|nr:hypothetical protein [Bordetella sp.]
MFEIPAGDFVLTMTPVTYVADDENDRRRDWITVRMTAEVPGIRAEKEWMLMRVEIDALQKRLGDMHETIAAGKTPAEVSFQAMEGVLELGLRVIDLKLGSIHLDFIVSPEPASGFKLSGSTVIDQSFLPGLALGLETLAAFGLDD